MEEYIKAKVRVFADKELGLWAGSSVLVKAKEIDAYPQALIIFETLDDEQEFLAGEIVYFVKDEYGFKVATWPYKN